MGKRHHTGEHFSVKLTNGPVKYRSGWEVKYMQWLDKNEQVIAYQYESLIIPYISNQRTNKIRNYKPDLVVERLDKKIVVEIKPSTKVNNRINQKKFNAAKVWCQNHGFDFEIVTEKELKILGIL